MITGLDSIIGLVVGLALGFTVRRSRLCTFGAIEDALAGGDFRRAKIFGLALAIAVFGTQLLILNGFFTPTTSTYLPMRSAVLAIAIGAVMFGFGMALVGTCSFGSLVRLGGGDLRSFVVVMVFSAAAYATLRGVMAPLRIGIVESASVAMPGGHPAGLMEVAEGLSGWPLRMAFSIGFSLLLVIIVIRDRRLHKAPRLLLAGVTLGLSVVAGWITTASLADPFETHRIQSLTFVAPVSRGVFAVILGNREWLEFGSMSALGVALGAFLSAVLAREFRWDAFDDHHEMKRHIAGAALMGTGGVLAGGCTIGQGLSAASVLAVSWPIAMAGIVFGAWLGIVILVEGSLRHMLEEFWQKLTHRR